MSSSVSRVRALAVAIATLFVVVGLVPPSQAAEPGTPLPVLSAARQFDVRRSREPAGVLLGREQTSANLGADSSMAPARHRP